MEEIDDHLSPNNYSGVIYVIINKINNKKYIGKTTRGLKKRWSEHKSDSKYKKHIYLYRSMNKYGIDNFEISILDKIENNNLHKLNIELSKLEKHYISVFNTYKNGYNCTLGGDGVSGIPLSPEHKFKIALYMRSDKNHNIGRICSEETKNKISKANKGKLLGENNPMYGEKREDLSKRNLEGSIKICQLNLETGELIKIWDSLRECSRVTGFNRSCITVCCKGKAKQSHGFLWKFYDSYLIENTEVNV